jgi:hypothetical protein
MTTPKEKAETTQTPIFDPFPEPNTIPSGWDLSGLIPDSRPVSISLAEDISTTAVKHPSTSRILE